MDAEVTGETETLQDGRVYGIEGKDVLALKRAVMTEEETLPKPKKAKILAVIFGVVVALLGAGSIGHFTGLGFFSYRLFLYGQGELYALNMSKEPLFLVVPGHDLLEVEAENARIVEIVGGTTRVEVRDKEGNVKGEYDVTIKNSHAFLKLTSDECLAVVELDPFYKGTRTQDIVIRAKLDEETRVWIPESKNVVWPRKTFPTRLSAEDGPGLWVELVGCPLLEDPTFLDAYLAVRLEERVKKARGETDEKRGTP
jgi:hypothetical protein